MTPKDVLTIYLEVDDDFVNTLTPADLDDPNRDVLEETVYEVVRRVLTRIAADALAGDVQLHDFPPYAELTEADFPELTATEPGDA
jgi:hypothetical protein